MRLERSLAKQAAKCFSPEAGMTKTRKCPKNPEKSLKDFIDDVTTADRHKLRVSVAKKKKKEK